ncbi:MAG: DNA internalization-related competence protein ComEC/Rec2 [Saccharofermentanales bacterium]
MIRKFCAALNVSLSRVLLQFSPVHYLFLYTCLIVTASVLVSDGLKDVGLAACAAALGILVLVASYFLFASFRRARLSAAGSLQVVHCSNQKSIIGLCLFIMLCLLNAIRCFQTILIPYHNAIIMDGKTMTTECKVISFSHTPEGVSGIAEDILYPDNPQTSETGIDTCRILSTVYGDVYVYGKTEDLSYGDILNAEIKFSQPSQVRNPGGFDEKRYYAQQGIYLKGRLVSSRRIRTDTSLSASVLADKVRSALIRSIGRMMPEKEAGMLVALILGDKSGVDAQTRKDLAEAGVSHIAAVSGSAVSFLFFPMKRGLRKLRIRRKYRNSILFASLIAFGYITLWTPSVTRALVMVMIALGAAISDKRLNYPQTLALAMTVIIISNPVNSLNFGFWFSVLATSGLIYFNDPISLRISRMFKIPETISSIAGMTLAAGIAVLPLQIMMNGEISAASVFSNILIMPAVQILIPAGLLAGIAGIAISDDFLLQLMALPLRGMINWLLTVSELVSKADFLKIRTGCSPVLIAIAAFMILIYMATDKKSMKKKAFLLSCCFLLSGMTANVAAYMLRSEVEVVFADVGQGDATLILLKNRMSILIDSGDMKNGESALNGILDYYDIKYPQIYIVTHTHADHCGAMISLMKQRGGKVLIVPAQAFSDLVPDEEDVLTGVDDGGYKSDDFAADLYNSAKENRIRIIEAARNDSIVIDQNTKIEIHNPSIEASFGPDRLNDNSLVMTITYKSFNILISGDISGDTETELVNLNLVKAANIYRIAHHGSPTSTNHDIISAVNPEVSVISVGFNFYGHPSKNVIARLKAAGSSLYRTDRNGAVIVKYNNGQYSVKSMMP